MRDLDRYAEWELIEEQTDNGGDYSWSVVGLFRKKDGRLFWDTDSGCSCNGPWDDWRPVDMKPLNAETYKDLQAEVKRITGTAFHSSVLAVARKYLREKAK